MIILTYSLEQHQLISLATLIKDSKYYLIYQEVVALNITSQQQLISAIKQVESNFKVATSISNYTRIVILPARKISIYQAKSTIRLNGPISELDIKKVKDESASSISSELEAIEVIASNYYLKQASGATFAYQGVPLGELGSNLSMEGYLYCFDYQLTQYLINCFISASCSPDQVLTYQSAVSSYYSPLINTNYLVVDIFLDHSLITLIVDNLVIASLELNAGLVSIYQQVAQAFNIDLTIAKSITNLHASLDKSSDLVYLGKEKIYQDQLSSIVVGQINELVALIVGKINQMTRGQNFPLIIGGTIAEYDNLLAITSQLLPESKTFKPQLIGARSLVFIPLLGAINMLV